MAIGHLIPNQSSFISQHIETVSHNTLQFLPSALQKLLDEAQITLHQLQAVVLGIGPGSFTGIKIGLAFTQGLLKGLPNNEEARIKVLGVSSLVCLGKTIASLNYQNGSEIAGSECVLLWPSTRTHGYALRISKDAVDAQPTLVSIDLAAGSIQIDEFMDKCHHIFLGDGWLEMAEYAKQKQWPTQVYGLRKSLEAVLKGMHTEASQQWSKCPNGFGLVVPEPLYLRPSTAEEKLLHMEKMT